MVETVPFRELPLFKQNTLFLDYIEGQESALQFFSHSPLDFQQALTSRETFPVNRKNAAESLLKFNTTLNAHNNALQNIEALHERGTYCVITGQQVGFFGGPVFTAYKILTAIRLAGELTSRFNTRFIPVFWGASEDHDFHEINHVHAVKKDGEIGKLSFPWSQIGNSVYDLPLGDKLRKISTSYIRQLKSELPHCSEVVDIFRPRRETSFVQWTYSLLARLYSRYGLVIADPQCLRPHMGDLFQKMHDKRNQIESILQINGAKIEAAGYHPALNPEKAGTLFTYEKGGKRVRVEEKNVSKNYIANKPLQFSPDVALRPLFADSALPVVVSVLGPGEIEYTAQLKELYGLFNIPQPLVFPRKSCTIVTHDEKERLTSYNVDPPGILLNGEISIGEIFRKRIDADTETRFKETAKGVADSFHPLKVYLKEIEPNLEKTWRRALDHSLFQIEKLKERTVKAKLSQSGYSKQEIQQLKNTILPKGRLQERVMPLPHFIGSFGLGFLDSILKAGESTDFSHQIIYL